MNKNNRSRRFRRLLSLTLRVMPVLALMLAASQMNYDIRAVLAAAAFSASKTDSLFTDVNGNLQANSGDTLEYTVTITNSSGADKTNVLFSDTIDSHTTLVGGSVKTTPIARNDSGFSTVGNVQLTVAVGSGVLVNDNDPDGSGAVTLTGITGCIDVTAPFVCAGVTTESGDVTLNADGSFTYNPAPGFSGTDSFTYSVQDTDANLDSATVSITVGQVVWFINNSLGAGDGRFTSPFNSIAAYTASTLDEAGDYIFIYHVASAYTGTITLLNTQQLIGHGVGLTIAPNLSIAAGTRPTIANITLANGNTVRGLNVSTSSGTGISGASVGTLTINNISVTNTNGVGVSLAGGALAVTFDKISASGGANGIVLSNTTGSFAVTGTGGTCTAADTSGCSGGTISGLTGADNSTTTPGGTGVVLNNANNVSLTRMYIHDASNYGIRGTSVNGFTLDNSVVSGVNGTNVASPYNDSSILFDNLSGTSAITNSDISGGFFRNIHVDNTTGTLTLTVNNDKIHNTGATQGDDGLFVEIGGGNATLTVTNNTFTAHGGDHFNLSLLGTPTVDLTFTGNLWSGGHAIGLGQGLFILGASFNGTFTYDILNNGTALNPLVGNRQGGAMHVNKGSGTGTFSGTISGNFIGNAAVDGSGSSEASGIDVEAHGSGGSHTTVISNNTVRQFHNDGILLVAGEGSAAFNATVTGNTVTNPDSSIAPLHGMHFNIGTLPADNMLACLDVKNNSLSTAGAEGNGGVDLRMRQRQLTTVRLPGYAGAIGDNAAVQTFLTATNANTVTTILASNTTTAVTPGGGYIGGTACPQPSASLPGPALAQESHRTAPAISLPDLGNFFAAIGEKSSRFLSGLIESARVRPAYASGETVNVTLGTLNHDQTVTITYRVDIENPVTPPTTTQVSNQGTVTGDGGLSVLTDDPDVGGATDPTVTPLADEIPPDTTIDTNPSDPSNNASPTFTFSGTDNVTPPGSLTFECQIDSGGFSACTSPHGTGALGEGSHTFEVRATDIALNVDASPASYTWTVDLTEPNTTIDSQPPDPDNDSTPTFTFSGDDGTGSGVASFFCKMDGGSADPCTSPFTSSALTDGSHTFYVFATDNATNEETSPDSYTWTVDTTDPTVTIDQAAGQADPTGTSPINFTVVFNEPATGFATGDVTLGGTAGATTATVTETAPNDGTTYNVEISGMTSDGTVTAIIAASKAQDAVGNDNTASTSSDNSVLYDTTPPDVTIDQAAGQDDPTNNSTINFTAVFTEPVTDFNDASDVTLSGTAGATTVNITGGPTTYNVAVSGMTGDGTVIATIPASVATDLAAKPNTASTSTDNTVMYDATQPGVTINQAAGQSDPTNASPINFTVVFTEPVTGFATGDVTLGGTAGATTDTVTEIAPNDGTTFNVAVSGMVGDGTVTASIAINKAQDSAGNNNTASTSADNTVVYDATPPDVTINQAAGQADPTNASPINFTVIFTEPVTGFATGDVTLGGTAGATTGTVTETAPMDGTTFNVAVSGMTGDGTVIAAIAASKAQDAAGNGNAASTSVDNTVLYDATSPSVTINQAAGQADPTNASPINFTVVFSESVTGFATGDVTLGGTAGATTGTVTEIAPNDGTTFNVAVSGMAGDGTVTATIAAGVAQDAAAKPNTASTSADNTVTYDTTAPTVTNVTSTSADGSYTTGAVIPITVTFSEAVTVTGTPQLTLETGPTDRVINYVSGSGTNTLTFNYTVQAGDSSADLDYVATTALALNGGTITDAALNAATLTLAAPGAAGSLGANKALVIDTTPSLWIYYFPYFPHDFTLGE